MRKLAWAIIIGLIAVVVWLVLALWNPGIAKLSNDGLTWAFGGLWIGIVGLGTWVRTTASVTNLAFLLYTVVILVVAVFFWAGVRKLWAKRPSVLKRIKTPSTPELPIGATGVRSTTPVGATTRPSSTTNPSPEVETLPVSEEESEA